jgi:hypothetical protein
MLAQEGNEDSTLTIVAARHWLEAAPSATTTPPIRIGIASWSIPKEHAVYACSRQLA